jgi:hypothetical protein
VEKSGGMRKERGRQLYQKKGLHFGKMDVQHPHFLNLAPTLGRAKSSIPHGTWRFHFFSKKTAKIRGHLDLHIHRWDFSFMKK